MRNERPQSLMGMTKGEVGRWGEGWEGKKGEGGGEREGRAGGN